jgi:hypothetical protein
LARRRERERERERKKERKKEGQLNGKRRQKTEREASGEKAETPMAMASQSPQLGTARPNTARTKQKHQKQKHGVYAYITFHPLSYFISLRRAADKN